MGSDIVTPKECREWKEDMADFSRELAGGASMTTPTQEPRGPGQPPIYESGRMGRTSITATDGQRAFALSIGVGTDGKPNEAAGWRQALDFYRRWLADNAAKV